MEYDILIWRFHNKNAHETRSIPWVQTFANAYFTKYETGWSGSLKNQKKIWIQLVVRNTAPPDSCIIPEQLNSLILPVAMMLTEPVAAYVLLSSEFYYHIDHGSMIVA